jgi:phage head maturation protease
MPWAVVKDDDNSLEGCHMSKDKAQDQQAALYANEGKSRPPKDDLVRGIFPGFEMRAAADDKPPTLFGYFTPFNEWARIDSVWEGTFMERTAPGSFLKTIAENLADIKALFQHGQDPQIGDKPLGPVSVLREEEFGPYYEVPLLKAPYVRDDLLPGLEAGLYGASYRFKVIREEPDKWWEITPSKATAHNPDRLPERTIKEVRLFEFGPVTFPAYASATAGIRSLTDEYIVDRLRSKPDRLRDLIESFQVPAPSDDAGQPPTSPERRGAAPIPPLAVPRFRSRKEFLEWLLSQTSTS